MSLRRVLFIAALFALSPAGPAVAEQIKLLAAVGYKPVLAELAAAYEKQSDNRVAIDYDTPSGISRRMNAGERFDLVIVGQDALEKMVGERKIVDDSITPLARVGIGVAVRLGASPPDISTAESLRRALLAAHAVAYTSPSAGGSFYPQLFQRLGILGEIRRKSVTVVGSYAAQSVAGNQADLALGQASEIIAVPGARFVGPIPDVLQSYTTYCAAIGLGAQDSIAATELMAWLSSSELEPLLRAKGMGLP